MYRLIEHKPLRLAVFGQQANARGNGVSRPPDIQRVAVQQNRAAVAPIGAKDQSCGLGATRANQARQRQYFASANGERDIFDGRVASEVVNNQTVLADLGGLLRKFVFQAAADHHFDNRFARQLADRLGADMFSVAQDHYAIGDFENLTEPVADVNDTDALGLELANNVHQPLDLDRRKCGARFVHYNDPGIDGQRLDDFHHLLVGHGEIATERRGIDGHTDTLEESFSEPPFFDRRNETNPRGFLTQENVLAGRQRWH